VLEAATAVLAFANVRYIDWVYEGGVEVPAWLCCR
jgi:hypothetical protein